jgi:hypothetical protein
MGGLDPIHNWQITVNDYNVGAALPGQIDSTPTILRFAYNLEVCFALKKATEPVGGELLN